MLFTSPSTVDLFLFGKRSQRAEYRTPAPLAETELNDRLWVASRNCIHQHFFESSSICNQPLPQVFIIASINTAQRGGRPHAAHNKFEIRGLKCFKRFQGLR